MLGLAQYVPPSYARAAMVYLDCRFEWIFPSGSVMAISLVAGLIFTAGAPAIGKCPVAPKSEIAHFTPLVTRSWSKIVCACGNSLKFFVWIMCCHTCCLVATCDNKLVAGGNVVGIMVG